MFTKPVVSHRNGTLYLLEHVDHSTQVAQQLLNFADLIKAPQGVYTFQVSSHSLWTAAAKGQSSESIFEILTTYSHNAIHKAFEEKIVDAMVSFGELTLSRHGEHLRLSSANQDLISTIAEHEKIQELNVSYKDTHTLWFEGVSRSQIKEILFSMELYAIDESNTLGRPLDIRLLRKTRKGIPFSLVQFQTTAAGEYLKHNEAVGGGGTLILPPYSGKTIVALHIISQLQLTTLILVENEESAHRWKNEIVDKTDLSERHITLFQDDATELMPVTICTYATAVNLLVTLSKHEWGMIVYDDAHRFPAYVSTSDIPSRKKLGLASTLARSAEDGYKVFVHVGPKWYEVLPRTLEREGVFPTIQCSEIVVPAYRKGELRSVQTERATKNLNKKVALELLLSKSINRKILIASYSKRLAEEYGQQFRTCVLTSGMSQREAQRIAQDFREGVERVLIFTQMAEKYDFGEVQALIALSYNKGSEREEYLRLGKLMNLGADPHRTHHFIAIVTEGTKEYEFYTRRRRVLINHGYHYQIFTLCDLLEGAHPFED